MSLSAYASHAGYRLTSSVILVARAVSDTDMPRRLAGLLCRSS